MGRVGGREGGGGPPELTGSRTEGRCSHNLISDQHAYKSAVFSSSLEPSLLFQMF